MIQNIGYCTSWRQQMSNGVLSCVNSCFNRRKGKVFCSVSWQAINCGYTTITQSVEDHGVSLAIGSKAKYPLFKASVRHLVGSAGWLKLRRKIAIKHNWCIWAEHRRQNGCYVSRDTTKWFCNMTTLGCMLQNRWKHMRKR